MAGLPQTFGVGAANILTDGATITIDNGASGPTINNGQVTSPSQGNFYAVTLGGNRTFAAFQNFPEGAVFFLLITQDGTGSRTATWNSNVDWAGGTAPTLTATAGASDLLEFVQNSVTGNWVGRSYALNIS